MGRHPYTVTVACVYVKGEYPYTPEYVERLYAMVCKWIDRPFDFVCLTDQPWLFSAAPIRSIPVCKMPGFAPWTKLELFNPARRWEGQRVLYLDLDVLIVSALQPILDFPADFAITADPPTRANPRTRDSFGRQIVRRFNSSVMVWNGGTCTELFDDFAPLVVKNLSGDQDWIGQQMPDAKTLPRDWFPRFSEIDKPAVHAPAFPEQAKIVLVKVPKNHIAATQWRWFPALWGG